MNSSITENCLNKGTAESYSGSSNCLTFLDAAEMQGNAQATWTVSSTTHETWPDPYPYANYMWSYPIYQYVPYPYPVDYELLADKIADRIKGTKERSKEEIRKEINKLLSELEKSK